MGVGVVAAGEDGRGRAAGVAVEGAGPVGGRGGRGSGGGMGRRGSRHVKGAAGALPVKKKGWLMGSVKDRADRRGEVRVGGERWTAMH